MGTEVLHPRDVLSERLRIPHASFQRRKNFSGNLNINRRPPNSNSSHRKTSPRPEKKKFAAAVEDSGGANRGSKEDGSVSGPVILLRRGESLDSLTAKIKGENFKVEGSKQEPKPVDDSIILGRKQSKVGASKPKQVDDSIILGRKQSKIGGLKPKQVDDSIILGKKRLEPKQICHSQPTVGYAGSAFSLSPPPNSLPLPSFFNKKQQHDSESVDNSATRDLRRLLRLE